MTDREFIKRERERNAATEAIRIRNLNPGGSAYSMAKYLELRLKASWLVSAFHVRWGWCQNLEDINQAEEQK